MTSAGIPKLRWRIGSLLGAGVLINYFDRICLSVAGPQLQQTLGLSATELGWLFSGDLFDNGRFPIVTIFSKPGCVRGRSVTSSSPRPTDGRTRSAGSAAE